MIRAFTFILGLTGLAYAAVWLVEQPGQIAVTFHGAQYSTSIGVGLLGLAMLGLLMSVAWGLLRFFLKLPSLVSLTQKARRHHKGMMALSRGMVAAGAGDAKRARQASDELARLMPGAPMTLLLKAQTAQMSEDRKGAEEAFTRMLESPETRLLGLRGLHIEAKRRGDGEAAAQFAGQARQIAALPWAAQAVLEHQTSQSNWQAALDNVEENARAKTIDKATANRQRAVLQTAIALEKNQTDPEQALNLVRDALKTAPDLVPAGVLAGRLLARRGDLRRASKVLEAAWTQNAHPDIALAYLDVRAGDSTSDRLSRAKTLAKLKPNNPESLLTVARAAIDARDFASARATLATLQSQYDAADGRMPSVRYCLTMAELEDKQNGNVGAVREWLARASRARRDPIWIADGVTSEVWAPVSPVTGVLDAFRWAQPVEQLINYEASANAMALDRSDNAGTDSVGWDASGKNLPQSQPLLAPGASPERIVAEKAVTAVESVSTSPLNGHIIPQGGTSPVIFVRPIAPDDPGEEDAPVAPKRFGFLSRN